MTELVNIQSELKAPKDKKNEFGNYNYRSAESILDALKPLLAKYEVAVTLSDDIAVVGSRYYVRATATIRNKDGESESVTAFARESEERKGMDPSQVTGSASSYARKYALGGLFAIDDNKDADDMDNRDAGKPAKKEVPERYYKALVSMAAEGQECELQDGTRMTPEKYLSTYYGWGEADLAKFRDEAMAAVPEGKGTNQKQQ